MSLESNVVPVVVLLPGQDTDIPVGHAHRQHEAMLPWRPVNSNNGRLRLIAVYLSPRVLRELLNNIHLPIIPTARDK